MYHNSLTTEGAARHAILVSSIWLAFAASLSAGEVQFNRDIRPLLSRYCFKCHGFDSSARVSDLRLDAADVATGHLASGHRAVVPHDPATSELIARISSSDVAYRMPPPETNWTLSTQEIDLLRDWIASGGKYETHWAYVRPVRPRLPAVGDTSWPRNPIDYFVLARMESEGLAPSPAASQRRLIRRLSLDLRGLPPTLAEVDAFLSDTEISAEKRDGAYDRVVDSFLNSPHYGERMAQDWLDAARFADTTGYAADAPRTQWLYRDWVIDALNRNLPFDQFTIEQLAGDMLPEATIAQQIASGFHRQSTQALGNNPRKEEFRVRGIVDRVNTSARVWLGMTLECAECHNHKFDPISQEEYYQLFAIFNNVPHLGERFLVHGPRLQVEVLALDGQRIEAQVMEEMAPARTTKVHVRGNFKDQGPPVTPGIPSAVGYLSANPPLNRLTFSRWLVGTENPLTSRVIVNRLWQQFFGRGLVTTDADFGYQGEWPSHPQLLDWLACEFEGSGWDVKWLVRTIVSSATYQQDSSVDSYRLRHDPKNRWLSRATRLRLPAEQIRDNALAASGMLDARIGGPSIFPPQPDGLFGERTTSSMGPFKINWETSPAVDRHRRGLYIFWKRTILYPSLKAFDAPSREVCVTQRSRTNTPVQALVLLNDPVFLEAAHSLARRVREECQSPTFERRLEYAFQLCLARSATLSESVKFQAFFESQHQHFRDHAADADRLVPADELATTAGIPSAEVAAWTIVASTLLNLDEMITRE